MISRSVAQIATASMRTSTSARFGTGTGFCVSLSSPGLPSTQAFMVPGMGKSLLVFTPGPPYMIFPRRLRHARHSGPALPGPSVNLEPGTSIMWALPCSSGSPGQARRGCLLVFGHSALVLNIIASLDVFIMCPAVWRNRPISSQFAGRIAVEIDQHVIAVQHHVIGAQRDGTGRRLDLPGRDMEGPHVHGAFDHL